MNPSNTQVTPEIEKVIDSNGDGHTVIPTPHTHAQSEVSGLTSALAGKQATLTFDNAPASGSNNPVKSGGIFTAIANAVADKLSKLTTFTTGNFVRVKSDGSFEDSGKNASSFADAAATTSALAGKQATLTFDTTPTANSTNPVTSGGVKTALDGKMNNKTIDQTPTDGNTTHLISSDAVYEALKDMAKWATVKQVTLGQGGADVYSQYEILVGDDYIDFFVYRQIRLVPVGGSDTICEYGAVKVKNNGPYYIGTDIDVLKIASKHHTSKFNLQVLQ